MNNLDNQNPALNERKLTAEQIQAEQPRSIHEIQSRLVDMEDDEFISQFNMNDFVTNGE